MKKQLLISVLKTYNGLKNMNIKKLSLIIICLSLRFTHAMHTQQDSSLIQIPAALTLRDRLITIDAAYVEETKIDIRLSWQKKTLLDIILEVQLSIQAYAGTHYNATHDALKPRVLRAILQDNPAALAQLDAYTSRS